MKHNDGIVERGQASSSIPVQPVTRARRVEPRQGRLLAIDPLANPARAAVRAAVFAAADIVRRGTVGIWTGAFEFGVRSTADARRQAAAGIAADIIGLVVIRPVGLATDLIS